MVQTKCQDKEGAGTQPLINPPLKTNSYIFIIFEVWIVIFANCKSHIEVALSEIYYFKFIQRS